MRAAQQPTASSPVSRRVVAIDPLSADCVEKARGHAVIGLLGPIRHRAKN